MFRSASLLIVVATALLASSNPLALCSYKDQKHCDADAKCSWCDAGAVPPQCHTIDDAKKLPPTIFYCDKLNATAVEKDDSPDAGLSCGDCGKSYQGCCLAFGIKGYPCGCHLQANGTGKAGQDCGDCGVAYAACCIGFGAKGYPCQCDVE